MATMLIDKKRYEVDLSKNVLQNCLLHNINIPYFCWHPTLGSVGSCRQCAVKYSFVDNSGVLQNKIVMSCMLQTIDNMEINVNDIEAYKFRKNIIELLMLHHPHDCPICPEGGSCHLQDMTMISGHNKRRYRYNKRVYKNQYLGKFISHEMNRCISCYRCVRFYKDYAGGKDFDVYGSSNNLYFGRVEDGSLENEHSGNLIEICPTGVFTDKLHNTDYVRKWDMQHSPSICNFCSVGCNIIACERLGKLRKVENRYNGDINQHFICDLGRFGHNFVNEKNLPSYPILNNGNKFIKLDRKMAIKEASRILSRAKRILGIGSSRSSIENNFALLNFVGQKKFSNGMLDKESKCLNLIIKFLKKNCIKTPTLKEIESYDAAIVIGQDITITAPRMSLSIRQLVKKTLNLNAINFKKICNILKISTIDKIFEKNHSSLFTLSNDVTSLRDISKINFYGDYQDQSRFLFFLEKVICKNKFEECNFFKLIKSQVLYIASTFLQCKKPLIILSLNDNDVFLTKACINLISSISKINKNTGSVFITQNSNSIGVSIMSKISLEKILNIACTKRNVAIILMETDLYRLVPKKIIKKIVSLKNKIIVLDHLNTCSIKKFNLSLPSNSFFESTGTVINYEVRAQKYFKVLDKKIYKKSYIKLDSWKWLSEIYYKINGIKSECYSLESIINLIVIKIPDLEAVKSCAQSYNFRIFGQKIPRYPNRASGRTILRKNKEDFNKNFINDSSTMFSCSMEGANNFNNKISHIPFVWNPGINSSHAWNNIDEKKYSTGKKLFNKVKKNVHSPYDIFFKKNINMEHLVVTRYNSLFSIEEMTQFSNFISIDSDFVQGIINYNHAKFLKLKKGHILLFRFNSKTFKVQIHFSKFLKSGYISLPIGSRGVPLFLNSFVIKKFKII
ncbi:NADH-quinone oxidoreductase subunit NuoG [Buchnera aphidicola (Chaitoregma tattakana)]|uniref:NADH-quinone oxidoreductase subunit NuoG n=1 Tax=Buchnera aphidicola TaxID=9 RepID=UPI0031B82583